MWPFMCCIYACQTICILCVSLCKTYCAVLNRSMFPFWSFHTHTHTTVGDLSEIHDGKGTFTRQHSTPTRPRNNSDRGRFYSDTSRINFDTLRFYSDKTKFSPESTANYYPLTSSIHIFSKYTS
jgi:hypothetical protein